ncbi:MAG: superoxide dismutase [Candidatus Wolfebacteria bacterium]|nr:superoxide dismutase [Candidatus Wolfebacteria bacterium]
MKYELSKLPYAYGALEPFIDAKTMELHHDKHHQAYADKLNAVLDKYPDLAEMSIEELLRNLTSLNIPEADKNALKNNGGGYVNHNLYWEIMDPGRKIDGALSEEITKIFGSPEEFKKLLSQTAINQFGSGWGWLVRDEKGNLLVYSTSNQDSPYLKNHTPIICLDVWEHAYYLKYQNRRQEYAENWWNAVKMI